MTLSARFPMTTAVISFNRHFFALAGAAFAALAVAFLLVENPAGRTFAAAGAALALWYLLASVVGSYLAYDRSDLYRLDHWPAQCVPHGARRGVLVHAGVDPTSARLQQRFSDLTLGVLDFHDPEVTTELSIRRAKELHPRAVSLVGAEHGGRTELAFDATWPFEDERLDVIFGINAIHELRRRDQRRALLLEARRVLKPSGRLVVIEQMCDLPNVMFFGPAAFHFWSRRTWLQSFDDADLRLVSERRLSPFMRIFVLEAAGVTRTLNLAAASSEKALAASR